jgi:hypothetical protein
MTTDAAGIMKGLNAPAKQPIKAVNLSRDSSIGE